MTTHALSNGRERCERCRKPATHKTIVKLTDGEVDTFTCDHCHKDLVQWLKSECGDAPPIGGGSDG